MQDFKLDNVQCKIRSSNMLGTSNMAVTPDSEAVRVTEVQMILDVIIEDKKPKQLVLFPGADIVANMMSGDEDMGGRTEIVTSTKIPPSMLTFSYVADHGRSEVFVAKVEANVKSKPKLYIVRKKDSQVETRMVLRPRVKLTDEQLVSVASYIGSDIRATFTALPQAKEDDDVAEDQPKKTVRRKNKELALDAVP